MSSTATPASTPTLFDCTQDGHKCTQDGHFQPIDSLSTVLAGVAEVPAVRPTAALAGIGGRGPYRTSYNCVCCSVWGGSRCHGEVDSDTAIVRSRSPEAAGRSGVGPQCLLGLLGKARSARSFVFHEGVPHGTRALRRSAGAVRMPALLFIGGSMRGVWCPYETCPHLGISPKLGCEYRMLKYVGFSDSRSEVAPVKLPRVGFEAG